MAIKAGAGRDVSHAVHWHAERHLDGERVDSAAGGSAAAHAAAPALQQGYRRGVVGGRRGRTASYTLKGDEIYVRAKVISSKPKVNGSVAGEFETAWTQPLVNAAK